MADLPTPELPPLDVAGRLPRLRARLDAIGCDALVVTDVVDIGYLTGFTGSAASLLVTADGTTTFVTDGRYRDQAGDQLAAAGVDAEIVIAPDAAATSRALAAASRGVEAIGLQADSVTWAQQRRFADETFVDAELMPTEGLVLELRAVKDAGEIARLAHAAAVADAALAEVRHRLHERPTEREFRRDLEDAMADRGADAPSFETIVGSGPNGAKPHARPTDRVIGASGTGELVVLDFGATYDGYHSDMTRTLVIGDPSATQQRMLEVVRAAQAAGVDAVRAGVACASVDRVCRDVIAEAGWADAFIHGTGHGIGLVIHEQPRLSAASHDALAVGNCITVEPGVYLPEHGGVRVEDSVVVTDEGCRLLTHSPYD